MIRTIDAKRFQIRYGRAGISVFFGQHKMKAVKFMWWRRPRIVLDLTDDNPIIIGWRH